MSSSVGDDARDRAARENPALVQHHEVIAGDDLVEQMGGPQYADVLLGHQPPVDLAGGVPLLYGKPSFRNSFFIASGTLIPPPLAT